jgi:hypothetical protein
LILSKIGIAWTGRLLAIGVVSIVALAACVGAGRPETASTAPAAKAHTSDDLPNILVSQDNAPEGMIVEPGLSGRAALNRPRPGGTTIDEGAFVDALTTSIGHTETGGYTSWAALFETSADAEQAFESITGLHEAEDGHGLEPLQPDVELSGDSVLYRGPYISWDAAGIYLWREHNLLLAVVGVGDYQPDVLRSIAEGIDRRAN